MVQNNEIDPLIEWAVFGNLDSHTDLELILLKGHLTLETIMGIVLKRNNISDIENYSFYRKVLTLETCNFENKRRKEFIILSLIEINKLRNKLAHEIRFNIENGEFEMWASNILNNFISVLT
ncbi:MAG: hypothetical protein WAQ28_17135 [Bacteroidia bacterium]